MRTKHAFLLCSYYDGNEITENWEEKKPHTIEYIIEVMFSEPKIRTNDIEMVPESHASCSHHLSIV